MTTFVNLLNRLGQVLKGGVGSKLSYDSLTPRGTGPKAGIEKLVTTVSTKGQVILPKTIRQRRAWDAGTRLTVEDAMILATALDLAERGMDFADALHLCRSAHCEGFVSFDRKLVKIARASGFTGARDA